MCNENVDAFVAEKQSFVRQSADDRGKRVGEVHGRAEFHYLKAVLRTAEVDDSVPELWQQQHDLRNVQQSDNVIVGVKQVHLRCKFLFISLVKRWIASSMPRASFSSFLR